MAPDNNDDRALLIQGAAGMMLHGSWQVSGIKNDDEEFYNESLGTFRFPIDEEAQAAGVPQNVEIGTAIGNGFSFNCWLDPEHTQVDEEKLKACYVLATQFYNDDIYNAAQVEGGGTPSIKGFDKTDDPNLKVVIDTFFNASNVQLWYDQYLPASVTEVHKDMMGELFGLTKTPEEVGQAQDEAMAKAREE
jgi:raffinose/stachyose/melibiose transport system substrate-binding protein